MRTQVGSCYQQHYIYELEGSCPRWTAQIPYELKETPLLFNMNDTCPDRIMRGGGAPMAAAVTAALRFYAAMQCLIDEPWPPSPQVPNGTHFDFIIVGAGTAGSTLAARLAEDYQFSVLLVEAGQRPPEESIVPGFKHVLKHSPYDWNFTTVNDGYTSQGLFNGQQLQHRGKVLGGSGSISDMVYSRGFPEDYYEWADIAGGDWNWTNVLDFFKKTEYMTDKNIINNSELMQFHGRKGEIEVSGVGEPVGYVDKLLEAFNELGFDIVDDMTYPYKIGAGRFSHTIAKGRRASALTALVNKVHSNNLSVINGTLVTHILLNENNTATGISAVTNGQVKQYFADREVIVSAGAFNTPKLLMLSGIGPKRHLDALGIKVIQDLPVGSNLHDHIMILNFLTIKNGTCPFLEHERYFELIKYLDSFTGIYGQSDSMGVHIPKDSKSGTPQFAIYPACMPIGGLTFDVCMSILGYNTSTCEELVAANSEHEMVSLAVVHLKPQSRGRVRLASTDVAQNPLIYSGTFSSLADFEGFTDAMRVALSVVNTTYFKSQDARVFHFKTSRCLTIETEEKRLRCQMMDYAMPAWHAVGTAAMASVVNEKFQVLGVKALRVVDSSAMPVIVRGNINAAVIMMAEQAAVFIKKHHLVSNQTVTDNDLYYLT